MTSPFVGEIQIFGFNFAPYGWAFANGATVPISQNAPLFSLVGTTYGGNGQTTFQLPNLIGRTACSQGQGPGLSQRVIGEPFGELNVTLLTTEMPQHSHTFTPSDPPGGAARTLTPKTGSGLTGFTPDLYVTGNPQPNATLVVTAVATQGNSTPHENQQPLLSMNLCIAMQGVFPAFN